MVSTANVTVSTMELTPCRVKLNSVDLGGANNVKVTMEYKKSPLKADQLGDTVLDNRVSGVTLKVECELTQINDKSIWKAAFPNSLLVTNGPVTSIVFQSRIGESDLSLAKSLVLHPLSKDDSDVSGDYTFTKVTSMSVSETSFSPTEQQKLKAVFTVLPDTSYSPALFMIFGDTTNGLVASTISSPTFTGTGTGSLTSQTAGVDALGETISVTCLGVPSANLSNWVVSGSVSGVFGEVDITNATPGSSANFSSSICSFTITSSATAYVAGDEYQMITTAKNYV